MNAPDRDSTTILDALATQDRALRIAMHANEGQHRKSDHDLPYITHGHVNIHGHEHGKPAGASPHINVAVEQRDYEPVRLDRLRALARALVRGHYPPGATTIERIAHLEQR